MSKAREQAQWRHGKTPVLIKYVDDHSKMLAEIAGRGFLALPGYAYDMENQLEVALKIGLSELNSRIISETIERELKQTGIDYDLAYKNALMAWELEKQGLVTAWAAEYAEIKQGMASDEEVLNLVANEVSLRGVTLLESKTAIELEAEAYRKALAELDGATAPYEVQLANAKLLTAQKKLEVIPILLEIVAKEQDLLAIEQTKAAAYTAYMAAEQEVVTKKETLEPFINDLATLSETFADKIASVEVPIEQQIANEKLTQATIAVEKAGYQVDELAVEIATEEKNLTLMDDKRALEVERFNYDQTLIATEISQDTVYHNDSMNTFETILQEERDATANVISDRTQVHTIRNTTALTSATTIAGEERSAETRITSAEISQMQRESIAQAASKITAQLTHVIS